MAEVKKTRIVLRNGATEAWNTVADTVILLKGEVGIEFDPSAEAAHKVRMKIGDGKSTWTNLEYFGEAEAQRFAKTYQVDIAAGADKLAQSLQQLVLMNLKPVICFRLLRLQKRYLIS